MAVVLLAVALNLEVLAAAVVVASGALEVLTDHRQISAS